MLADSGAEWGKAMRRTAETIAFLLGLAGVALAQGDNTTVETTTTPQGMATVTTTITRDPCGPISSKLDSERCESALTPTRTIYVLVGSKKTIEFDRPVREIKLTDDVRTAIDVTPGETNTTAIIAAMGLGRVNAFFFGAELGQRKGAAGPVREVLLAATIIAVDDFDAAEPPHTVRIFHGGANRILRDGAQYKCTSFNCESPEKWGPGR